MFSTVVLNLKVLLRLYFLHGKCFKRIEHESYLIVFAFRQHYFNIYFLKIRQ